MRKLFICLLVAAILLSGQQAALALGMTFTHPELGEPMTLGYANGMPFFKIYGFTYYQIVDPDQPYRGLKSNRPTLDPATMATAEEALNAIFNSVEGRDGSPAPQVFACTGVLEPYQEQLNNLERADKVRATLLLNGFSGAAGYDEMNALPGFEEEDFSELKDLYTEFNVRIGEKTYPYRVIQYYAEEQDAQEHFFERYNFVLMDGVWRLLHITREYAEATNERETYVHGMAGFTTETAGDNSHAAMWDLSWGAGGEEIAAAEGASEEGNSYKIAGAELFRIPCDVTFNLGGEGLESIAYAFHNEQSFYSAFVSLYTRLADPIVVSENGDMTWSLNDTYIYLKYDKDSPGLTVSREAAAP